MSALSPSSSSDADGAGSFNSDGCSDAIFSNSVRTRLGSEPYAAPTRMATRLMLSLSVQLSRLPVMNDLLGTISSFRSPSTIVVARKRMRETVPVVSPIVITSPTRIGRSNSRMIPETKFAKISCRPKPSPTEAAATSHCTLFQPMPIWLKASTIPAMKMA